MTLRLIKTKRKLKDENIHLHSLVRHLQIELENARLDLGIKEDTINGYRNENIKLRQRINSMYDYYTDKSGNKFCCCECATAYYGIECMEW